MTDEGQVRKNEGTRMNPAKYNHLATQCSSGHCGEIKYNKIVV